VNLPRIGITPGEPAGIGPDVCLQTFDAIAGIAEPLYFCSRRLMAERARQLNLSVPMHDFLRSGFKPGVMNIAEVDGYIGCQPGKPCTDNSAYVIAALQAALTACEDGTTKAITTGPVNKAVISESGAPFSGHTEWFAEQTGTPRVVMMLLNDRFRVALATTHLPLTAVPAAITKAVLEQTLNILANDLKQKFGIAQPRINVLGLNPHAGEDGHLGREELETIIPVMQRLKNQGMDLRGPLPADTAFTNQALADQDVVLAMYHDQGLPVLKHASFGNAVNVTLGLPIIRTSVDHGTAFDLAGSGRADGGSLISAVSCAAELAGHQA